MRAQPPEVAIDQREPADLDRTGSTAVLDSLRLVDSLAEQWTAHPPAQLRSGGVGVRDLRRTAKDLGVDEPTAALVAEVAAAAGLINSTHRSSRSTCPRRSTTAGAGARPPRAGPTSRSPGSR